MLYKGIVEAWEEFRETIQSSKYMQRLTLKEDERLFMQGYMRGFDMAKLNFENVNRLEVINHKPFAESTGRVYTNYDVKEVEIQLQDENKTMKIFIK